MKKNFRSLVVGVLAVGTFCVLALPACADNGVEALRQTSKAFSQVAKKATPAVVSVQVEKTIKSSGGSMRSPFGNDDFFERFFGPEFRQRMPQDRVQMGQGSGFIISKDGYILSNNHVVGEADKIKVTMNDGREFDAKLIGADPQSDVAVIKIDADDDLPVIELGDSDRLEVGEWVIAVGNPFGLNASLTVGVVSAKGRSDLRIVDDGAGYEDFIQTDAAINPGNSGGPLLDIDGKAIGLNTAIYSQSGGYMGIGFAIPINMAKSIKDQLVKSGKVVRGYVGIRGEEIDPKLAKAMGIENSNAIQVIQVVEDSPAGKGGLEAGDIIVKMDGKDIEGWSVFRNKIAMMGPDKKVEMVVLRDSKEKTIKITVGSADEIAKLLGTSEAGKKLGIQVQEMTKELADRFGYDRAKGVIISSVESDSVAGRAGIKEGMLIVSIDRKRVGTIIEYNEALEKALQDDEVLLQVSDGNYVWWLVLTVE